MATTGVNGIELYYETDGDGPPLMLIAGLASDSQSWAPVRPGLAARRRLILPDNRGAGRTRPMDAPFSLANIADDIAALLDHLGVERAPVLGHSMGGMIAITFAARHPDRAEKLIVAGAAPAPSLRNALLMRDLAKVRAYDPELFFRLFFYWLFAPPFFADPAAVDEAVRLSMTYPYPQTQAAHEAQAAAAAGFDPTALEQVRAPTLAIAGGKDLLFPPDEIRRSLSSMSGLSFSVIEAAGHSIHWDQPAEFVDVVLEYLG